MLLCKQYSVEFSDGKFYSVLIYLRVFWAYRNSWILETGFGGWTLHAGLWMLGSGRWTLNTVVEWFRTESELSF